jgi:hypothetical protein
VATAPDDLCPHCGIPQPRGARGAACAHCGRSLAEPPGGHLTPFGYGVCGFVAGGQVGAAVALTDPDITLGDPRLTLFPILGAGACCALAAWLGSRLSRQARRGFEFGLAATLCGTFTVAVASLLGLSSAESLISLGACTAIIAGGIIRSRLSRHRTTGGITREC